MDYQYEIGDLVERRDMYGCPIGIYIADSDPCINYTISTIIGFDTTSSVPRYQVEDVDTGEIKYVEESVLTPIPSTTSQLPPELIERPADGLYVPEQRAGFLNKDNAPLIIGTAVIGVWAVSKGLTILKYLAIGTAGVLIYREYKKRQLKYG
jgi:hypothetical protein